MLTDGAEKFSNAPQVCICRKREISPSLLDEYFYMDSMEAKVVKAVTPSVLDAMTGWDYDGCYIAKVDSQVEFSVRRRVFDALSKYLYPAWYADYTLSSFENQPSGFLILLRVFKIHERVHEKFLVKGRQGGSMIYRLYDGNEKPRSIRIEEIEPTLSNTKFEYIKRELIHTLKTENAYIECFENSVEGRRELSYKAEIRRAFAPKRDFESGVNLTVDRAQLDYDEIFNNIVKVEPSLIRLATTVKKIVPPQWGEADKLVSVNRIKVHQNYPGILRAK